jgi:hypothetical protein
LIALAISLGAFWLCAALGALGAWLMRRRTTLSVRNLYLGAASAAVVCAAIVLLKWWDGLLVAAPLAAAPIAGTLAGRRWRLADLGAGEELRDHELARRWAWQPAPRRRPGERVYIRSQGEIIHERPWPASEAYVPMTADPAGPRLPRGEGQHIFSCGGTGAGKTTRCGSSRRGHWRTDPPCLRSTRRATRKPSRRSAQSRPPPGLRSS